MDLIWNTFEEYRALEINFSANDLVLEDRTTLEKGKALIDVVSHAEA